jgi:hypothetical protein
MSCVLLRVKDRQSGRNLVVAFFLSVAWLQDQAVMKKCGVSHRQNVTRVYPGTPLISVTGRTQTV